MSTAYDGIYFNQSRVAGQVRMSTDGLGWRATQKVTSGSSTRVSQPFLLPASELLSATWSRGAHDYMVQIETRSGGVVSLDGFEDDQFTSLQRSLGSNLDLTLEHREHSLRGWNWGKAEFERNELVFNVASKPDFEIPYSSIASSNVIGKSEVAVELSLASQAERTTSGDEVVELRFYIPGKSQDAQAEDEEGSGPDEQPVDEDNAVNSAHAFHEQLQERADIGSAAGSEFAQFTQVLFTTPRGRYDIAFFADAFRLHGKTYDYKVLYESVQRLFVLPRMDEQHNIIVAQLEPPLRQGQTRYPFLVMQFAREDDMEVELNIEDEEFAKYEGKLERKYDGAAHEVVASLFHGLSGRKITHAGSFKSTRNQSAIACLLKATEASLYPLEKAFLLLSKAPIYVPYTEVDHVRFSRLATGNRSFDLTIILRSGGSAGEIQLTSIARDEQPSLEQYFDIKNIKMKNDAEDARKARIASIEDDMMGSQDEDSEEDADFDEEPASDDDGSLSESGSAGSDDSGDDDDVSEVDDDDDDASEVDTGDSKIAPKQDRKRQRQ